VSHRRLLVAAVSMVAAVTMAACTSWRAEGASPGSRSAPAVAGIHKIKHVIVIMMENRSFDSYFGTNEGRIASRRASACQTPGMGAVTGHTRTIWIATRTNRIMPARPHVTSITPR